jgi:hypothetical protein
MQYWAVMWCSRGRDFLRGVYFQPFRASLFTPATQNVHIVMQIKSVKLHITMESVKNEFLGFEDGFEGFPKHLPDDCLEYTLFVIDSKLNSQKELLARLEAVRKESKKLTDNLLNDYIWQRDGFGLEVESGKGMPSFTNYGTGC